MYIQYVRDARHRERLTHYLYYTARYACRVKCVFQRRYGRGLLVGRTHNRVAIVEPAS